VRKSQRCGTCESGQLLLRQQDLCPALRDAAFSLTTAQKKRRGKNSFQPGKKLMPHIIGIRFQRTLRKIGCAERDFKLNCFRRFSRKDKTSGDHQAPPRFGQAFTKNLSILCVFASSWQRPGPIHHEDTKARRITKRKILARLRRISGVAARRCTEWFGGSRYRPPPRHRTSSEDRWSEGRDREPLVQRGLIQRCGPVQ